MKIADISGMKRISES